MEDRVQKMDVKISKSILASVKNRSGNTAININQFQITNNVGGPTVKGLNEMQIALLALYDNVRAMCGPEVDALKFIKLLLVDALAKRERRLDDVAEILGMQRTYVCRMKKDYRVLSTKMLVSAGEKR